MILASFFVMAVNISQLSETFAQEERVDEAIHLLQTTKPLSDPFADICDPDPVKREAASLLHTMQIGAAEVLRLAHDPRAANVLIPYLNYQAKGYHPYVSHFHREPEKIEVTRSHWPIFSVILDIPDSDKALMEYALNAKNPPDFRFASLAALKYKSIDEFKSIYPKLSDEFMDSEGLKDILKVMEKEGFTFHGTMVIAEILRQEKGPVATKNEVSGQEPTSQSH